jgi:hypothetical protein
MTVADPLGLTNMQIGMSNVPGMGNDLNSDGSQTLAVSRYDIFANHDASPTGCSDSASWGYVTSATFPAGTGVSTHHQTESGIASCGLAALVAAPPANAWSTQNGCTLGTISSTVINGTNLGPGWSVGSTPCDISKSPTSIPAQTPGCNPAYTGNTTLCIPGGSSATTQCADAGNEDYCRTSAGGVVSAATTCDLLAPTSGEVTPGGVLYYFPATAANCMKTTNGSQQVFAYGSAGLYDVVFYAPNNCSASLEGGHGGQFVGWGYMPCSTYPPTSCPNESLTLLGLVSPFNGGLDVWSLYVSGTANVALPGDIPAFNFVSPLASRLLVCTNTPPGCPAP